MSTITAPRATASAYIAAGRSSAAPAAADRPGSCGTAPPADSAVVTGAETPVAMKAVMGSLRKCEARSRGCAEVEADVSLDNTPEHADTPARHHPGCPPGADA